MFLVASVCWFACRQHYSKSYERIGKVKIMLLAVLVCLFVCGQHYAKSYEWNWDEILWRVPG